SGVIIKDWVSDAEDIFQSNDLQATNKPSFKRIEFTNARNEYVKPKQAEKPRMITQNPKRMAKKSILKNIGKITGQREIRPVWNSAQRINHQNKFVPSAVLTRFGRVPVSAAKQSSLRATTSTSTFRPVNTATHTNRVNVSKLRTNAFHKSHSPIRRPFYKSTTPNTRISNEKVNTVRVNGVNTVGQTTVSVVKGTTVTAVKASADCWMFQTHDIEEFWNTSTSKTVNSVKQIHAIVDGKAVVISESSVRSDLLFNDEDGITCLTNDEIFENLALMGYELPTKLTFQKGLFSPQ
ncbi:hypothetical protein Tco_0028799, partial [Tanacetum coccineum]